MQEYLVTVHDEAKSKPLIDLLRTLDYIEITERKTKTNGKKHQQAAALRRLAGIWKGRDITIEELRARAWKKRDK